MNLMNLLDGINSFFDHIIKIKSLSALFFAFFLFQCAPQGVGILGQQSFEATDVDPKIANAPFAYDAVVDTISYNSCTVNNASGNYNNPEMHGIKIGVAEGFADETGTGSVRAGLKIRSDFLQYVSQKFKPDYPSEVITGAQVQAILNHKDNVANKDPKIQFAIRRPALNYSARVDQIYTQSADLPIPMRDVLPLSPTLASDFLGYSITKGIIFTNTGTVLAEGPRVYNLSSTSDAIKLEGTLNFNSYLDPSMNEQGAVPNETDLGVYEHYSQSIRDAFNTNSQMLTLTYGGVNPVPNPPDATIDSIENIRRPFKNNSSALDMTKAYGRGFSLKFSTNDLTGASPKNKLTAVNEMDLFNGAPANSSWKCEQFVIVRAQEWNNNAIYNDKLVNDVMTLPTCHPLVATDIDCSVSAKACENLKMVKLIRRHYSQEQWNIGLMELPVLKTAYTGTPARDTMKLCIAPTNPASSCYLRTENLFENTTFAGKDIGVQYTEGSPCYLSSGTFSGSRDEQRKLGRCAQYASICSRSSPNF